MKPQTNLRNHFKFSLCLMLVLGSTSISNGFKNPGNDKVIICHVPPGNPSNRHTIEVSKNALQAHLDHGDFLGSCEDLDNPPQPPINFTYWPY